MTREELDRAIGIVDRHMAEVVAAAETQAVWRALRGELRRERRMSEQALPAVSTAAQHAVLARDHAARALEALGHMTRAGTPDSVPPPPPREDDEG